MRSWYPAALFPRGRQGGVSHPGGIRASRCSTSRNTDLVVPPRIRVSTARIIPLTRSCRYFERINRRAIFPWNSPRSSVREVFALSLRESRAGYRAPQGRAPEHPVAWTTASAGPPPAPQDSARAPATAWLPKRHSRPTPPVEPATDLSRFEGRSRLSFEGIAAGRGAFPATIFPRTPPVARFQVGSPQAW